MRFLIDMPLSPALAEWLTRQGHQAIHASHMGMSRSPDIDILDRARAERRVVITADLDYPRLIALAQAEGPGIILFRGGDYSEQEALQRLGHVFEVIPEGELQHSIIVIERARLRRRRLPIEPTS